MAIYRDGGQRQRQQHALTERKPYDYIEKNARYDKIIALGTSALPALEKALKEADGNGLHAYIIALAMQEISGVDVDWENARQFEDAWESAKL